MNAVNNYVGLGQLLKIYPNYSAPISTENDKVLFLSLSGSSFTNNIGGVVTSIFHSDIPDLEVRFVKSSFNNNFGPITNDFHATRIRKFDMLNSYWNETQ